LRCLPLCVTGLQIGSCLQAIPWCQRLRRTGDSEQSANVLQLQPNRGCAAVQQDQPGIFVGIV
jgi:hypothetical protein